MKKPFTYTVHPAVAHCQTIIKNMKDKTGKSIEEWAKIVCQSKLEAEQEQAQWLKKEFKLGGGTIELILSHVWQRNFEYSSPEHYIKLADEWVENMYSGSKKQLRPIYETILKTALAFGQDVKISPCKTMVPLYRKNVFAQIKAATKTRIDLGLCLRDVKTPAFLVPTGGLEKGDRITHKVSLSSLDDFNNEIKTWMKKAYDAS